MKNKEEYPQLRELSKFVEKRIRYFYTDEPYEKGITKAKRQIMVEVKKALAQKYEEDE